MLKTSVIDQRHDENHNHTVKPFVYQAGNIPGFCFIFSFTVCDEFIFFDLYIFTFDSIKLIKLIKVCFKNAYLKKVLM